LRLVARRPFEADGTGGFRVHLRRVEREVLRRLPAQTMDLIEARHPATARLFPVAYPDDPAAQAELEQSVGSELADRHRQALTVFVALVDARQLDAEQLADWVHALEVMRLVVGTHLDVGEDMAEVPPTDPAAPSFAVYHYLSALQDEAIQALATILPADGDTTDDAPGADDAPGRDDYGGLAP
jgi:hypothetical protein